MKEREVLRLDLMVLEHRSDDVSGNRSDHFVLPFRPTHHIVSSQKQSEE
ncbi:MAG: hypothetical protein QF466_11475 [Desulfobacterales bacterium]|nr:hypothetical protein [Desulfobacterales bacterium]MDP6682821.1 hypothetical protein [Desulfobacterales bacterium]